MSFKDWAIKTYLNKDNPNGDLAEDIFWDETFPKENEYNRILNYIKFRSHYDRDVIDTFKYCWRRYLQWKKVQQNCI